MNEIAKAILFGLVCSCTVRTATAQVSLFTELRHFAIGDLPVYRTGTSIEEQSTYDRTGGNNDGFAGTYSFVRRNPDSSLVLLDIDGPGEINRFATPTPTTDTLDFYIDDTTRPVLSIAYPDLFSGKVYPFVAPLSGSGVGGYYTYFPILFQQHCRIVSRGHREQFHQIQYRLFPAGTKVESFSYHLSTAEEAALRQITTNWGTSPEDYLNALNGQPLTRHGIIKPHHALPCIDSNFGGRLIGLQLKTDHDLAVDCRYLVLRITWDDEKLPAIDCPVPSFFGFSFGRPSMRGLLIGSDGKICYSLFPMPFDHRVTVEIINTAPEGTKSQPVNVTLTAWFDNKPRDSANEGKFYTQFRQGATTDGIPWTIAHIRGKGHYVGTVLKGQGPKPGLPLFWEGDDSTVVDGHMTIHGTGTEDYFNGGWYNLKGRWDTARSFPLSGCLEYSNAKCRTGGYRFYLNDKLPFNHDLLQTIEHGGEGNHVPAVYTSVAYYYSSQLIPLPGY